MSKKTVTFENSAVVRLLTFWATFGLGYVVFRWLFHAGHLAAAFAYLDASASVLLIYLKNLTKSNAASFDKRVADALLRNARRGI